jgi:hypothetical protein
MNLTTFSALLAPGGQSALEAAARLDPREGDFLRHFGRLSRRYPRDLARAALEVAILRRSKNAAAKFGRDAGAMYFDREALEQASSSEVSSWRAQRYRPFGVVADLGCSVGSDTICLARGAGAETGAWAVGVDRDPVRAAMAAANARATGVHTRTAFVVADLERGLPLGAEPDAALFFDPGRRKGERRARSVTGYRPPLGVIRGWLPVWPALGVKVSPAVRAEELSDYDAEIEFISVGGELKEAVLWFGPLRRGDGEMRATVLPGGHTMSGAHDLGGGASAPPRLSEPKAWLYEPDPSVIRAGLVRALGARLDASQLDPDIAFLTADRLVDTPFATALAVEDWMPFHLKRVRAYLRERGVGRVTVKKRGSPVDAGRLGRALRGTGGGRRLLVLTHLDGRPIAIVCR